MRYFLSFLILVVIQTPLGAEDDPFLEGFPSVPLLEGFTEDLEARLVFDTVAGTIAETVLFSGFEDPLIRYRAALEGLGWGCQARARTLGCAKDGTRVDFAAETSGRVRVKTTPMGGA